MGAGSRTSGRDRSHSRDRHRHREHSHRHRSRSRERSHRHDRDSDSHRHDDRHSSRRTDRRDRHSIRHAEQSDRWELDSSHSSARGSNITRFTSGGKVFEDNGGMPMLPDHQQGFIEQQQRGYGDTFANQQHASGFQEQGHHHGPDAGYHSHGYESNGQSHGEEEQYPAQHHYQHQRTGHRRAEPSSAIHIRGIPDEYDEADINRLFSAWPGVLHVRIVRDRGTGQSRGFGFVEFDTVESAQQIMETDARYQFDLDGTPLRLDYSHGQQPAAAVSASATSDWICPACSAVNFSRRQECYRCNVAKPAHAPPVHFQPDVPSHILKISGLEQHISEGNLQMAIAHHATVKDIRLVLDKFTGAPRGFAFVHFHSVADASRVLHALQNAVIDGQETPLRLAFAKDKPSERPAAASSLASDALQAAQAMQQYAGWEPKEFSEQNPAQESAWQPQEFQEPEAAQPSDPAMASASHTATYQQAAAPSAAAAGWQSQHQQLAAGQNEMQGQDQGQWQQDASGAWIQQPQVGNEAQQQAGAEYQEWQGAQQQGHQQPQQQGDHQQQQQQQQGAWDGASGQADTSQQWQQQGQQQPGSNAESAQASNEQLPHASTGTGQSQQPSQGQTNPQSGFVYDSASGYWHDAVSGYYYDANTGLYCHPQTQQWYSQDSVTGEFKPYAAVEGISTAGANALEATTAQVDSLHAPEVTIKAVATTKKKGAVIGSAPKLSHEGLVAAAKAAEEKAAAEAALAKKAKQVAAKKLAAETAKANRQKAKLAVPGGGVGFQAGPNQATTTPEVAADAAQPVAGDAQSAGSASGVVQGKIYQGKWSRKK